MAISRVASTAIANVGISSTPSISHAGGNCDGAFVFINVPTGTTINSITYGGTGMTQLASFAETINGRVHAIWGLRGPATGTQTIQANLSASGSQTDMGAVTYIGLSQTVTFPNASSTGGSATNTDSVSITTTRDDCVLLALGGHDGSGSTFVSAGGGLSAISSSATGSFSDVVAESSPLDVGPAGSYTVSVSAGSSNQDLSLVVIAIAPIPFRNIADSVSVGASRSAASTRVFIGARAPSLSMLNSASRLAALNKGIYRALSDNVFNGAGRSAVLKLITAWHKAQKTVASFAHTAIHTATWSKGIVHNASFAHATKHTPTWTKQNQNSTSWSHTQKS